MFRRNGEIVIGVVLMVISVFYGYYASTFPTSENEIGPSFIPYINSLCLTVLGFNLIIKGKGRSGSYFQVNRRQLLLFLYLVIYLLLLPTLGFIPVTLVFTFLLSRLYGFKGYVKPLFSSVLLLGLIYILFNMILRVPLSNL